MRANKVIKLVLLSFLVFFVSGCGNAKTPTAPVPTDYNQLVSEVTGKDPITGDNLDLASGWKQYAKKTYGLSLSYPADWIFTEAGQGNHSVLLQLSNVRCQVQCPPQYVGIEVKSGIQRNTSTDFSEWIGTAVTKGDIPGIPAGTKVSSAKVGKRSAWLAPRSVISGANDGYTYFIEQDESHYVYVSAGFNNLLSQAKIVAKKIVDTTKIGRLPIEISSDGTTISADDGDGTVQDGTSIDRDVAVPQIGEKRYLNNYYRFSLIFPGNCKLLNITEDIDPPVQMELSLCTPNGESQKMGVRIFKDTTADVVAQSIFGMRGMDYTTGATKIMLSDSVIGTNINIYGSANSLPERWVIAERNHLVYVLYVLDNTTPYKEWFDFIVRRFKFLY